MLVGGWCIYEYLPFTIFVLYLVSFCTGNFIFTLDITLQCLAMDVFYDLFTREFWETYFSYILWLGGLIRFLCGTFIAWFYIL